VERPHRVALGRRRGASVVLVATVGLTLISLSLGAPARAGARARVALSSEANTQTPVPVPVRLSNLHTLTRWGYPSYEAAVRSFPSPHASTLGRLRFLTGDGQAEIYLALAEQQPTPSERWLRVELPGRPNGRTGWIPRDALGTLHTVDGWLQIDERDLRATLFRDGHPIFEAPVGVGKASTVTPTGHFYVIEKLITVNAPVYGPLALGTSAYAPTLGEWPGGGVVGIHGTDEPQLIPGRPSHGCIRMRNGDIERLWHLIQVGTPIEIT
jgi:L,D-transpeptidase catalytic domain